jgi:hypothetical protein
MLGGASPGFKAAYWAALRRALTDPTTFAVVTRGAGALRRVVDAVAAAAKSLQPLVAGGDEDALRIIVAALRRAASTVAPQALAAISQIDTGA